MPQTSQTPTREAVRMPDFCKPRRGVRQTMQSALKSLSRIGVESDRIQIRRIGSGWPSKAVVFQHPAPGTALTANSRITLSISAPSAVDALPFALRDEVEGGMGTDRLMPILDTPIAKLEAFIVDAGGFFELRPERPVTSWRWVREIFALEPGPLPDDVVYRLARFLPALHQVAGTERGVALGLHSLFSLPLRRLELRPELVPLPAERRTRLGQTNGRLGVDAVIGDGVTVRALAVVNIGPVTLAEYLAHDTSERRKQRELLYELVMPTVALRPVREEWFVLPPENGLVLGAPDEPVRLGLNSRFMTATPQG
jgi:hypothetical protein